MTFFDEYAYNEYSGSKNLFAIASVILGGIAIVTVSSIVPAISAGSLSIIFAILSRKGTAKLHPLAKIGTMCSSVSIILSMVFFILYMKYMPTLLQNEAYRSEMKYMLESVYGTEFNTEEYLERFADGTLFNFSGE